MPERKMMVGNPNAISPVVNATEAVFDEDYWEQKAKRCEAELLRLRSALDSERGRVAGMEEGVARLREAAQTLVAAAGQVIRTVPNTGVGYLTEALPAMRTALAEHETGETA